MFVIKKSSIICENMMMWSVLVFQIRTPTCSTLFIKMGFIHRARTHRRPYSQDNNFLNQVLVLNYYHCKNVVMWSSLVFEIQISNHSKQFFSWNFNYRVQKHRRLLSMVLTFLQSFASGKDNHCKIIVMCSSLLFLRFWTLLIQHYSSKWNYKHRAQKHRRPLL